MTNVVHFRNVVVCALASAVSLVVAPGASAATLSTPDGNVTTLNAPNLAWTVAAGETTTEVVFATSPAVDAAGAFTSRRSALTTTDFTVDSSGNGSLAPWSSSSSASSPLWPGTYYWQVGSTVASVTPGAAPTQAWTAPRKLVVKRVFALKTLSIKDGKLTTGASSASFPMTFRITTNLQSVPFRFLSKLNGHTICARTAPLPRVTDIRTQQVVATVKCTMKASFYKLKGTNTILFSGTIGSMATTGAVVPFKDVSTFTL